MDPLPHWPELKSLFRDTFRSSYHFAIATVDESGRPHVTPIGSLVLTTPGHGFYFERFPRQLPRNLEANDRVCVLAVNSSRGSWVRALLWGRFARPPAVRLHGRVGAARAATEDEIQRLERRFGRLRFTRGHRILWRDMTRVRDIEFDGMDPVWLGPMTKGTWSEPERVV